MDDGVGGTNNQIFKLTVNAKPKLNTVTGPIPFFEFGQGSNTINLAQYFTDPDGDALTYTVVRANGQATGAWLSINAAGVLSIVTTISNVGLNHLTCKATDPKSAYFSQDFDILINSPPQINNVISQMYATQNQMFAYTLPTTLFKDVDLNPILVSVYLNPMLSLPSWLNYDQTLQLLYGTP